MITSPADWKMNAQFITHSWEKHVEYSLAKKSVSCLIFHLFSITKKFRRFKTHRKFRRKKGRCLGYFAEPLLQHSFFAYFYRDAKMIASTPQSPHLHHSSFGHFLLPKNGRTQKGWLHQVLQNTYSITVLYIPEPVTDSQDQCKVRSKL